jgi:hypothetical protein
LIIFDTLARNFGPGDPNTTRDVDIAIHNLEPLTEIGTVGLVAHTGHKNKDRPKGSISLGQAADQSYLFKRTCQGGPVIVICKKTKDFPKAEPLLIESKWMEFEINGIPANSLNLKVIDEGWHLFAQSRADDGKRKPGSAKQKKAIAILCGLYQSFESRLNDSGADDRHPNVSIGDWLNAIMAQEVYSNKKSTQRAIRTLVDNKTVQLCPAEHFVYPPELYEEYKIGGSDEC